jgi:hypothetical protein
VKQEDLICGSVLCHPKTESRAVPHASTATSSAANDFVRLRPVADLPQRPRTTSLPGVRIERVTQAVRIARPLIRTRLASLDSDHFVEIETDVPDILSGGLPNGPDRLVEYFLSLTVSW